ncbi:MAG: hypothetical protein C0624_08970 [Desulfuromonas sp.]|nr:MAG: hypothetical protein C0624_08970 [Desulfuromonas sp.]
MKRESIWLVGFAAGVVVLTFLPALIMAAIRFAGYCPYSHETHVLISQKVQILWMSGVVLLFWSRMGEKYERSVRAG